MVLVDRGLVSCEKLDYFSADAMMQKTLIIFFPRCSMIGSDPATTNYPGKKPQGLDLPSDVAEEIQPQ